MIPLQKIVLEEWDFSSLVGLSIDTQRVALDWEMDREWHRLNPAATSLELRALGFSEETVASVNGISSPWLLLTKTEQASQIKSYAQSTRAAVRQLTLGESAHCYGAYDHLFDRDMNTLGAKLFKEAGSTISRTVLVRSKTRKRGEPIKPTIETYYSPGIPNPVRRGETVYSIAINWGTGDTKEIKRLLNELRKQWRAKAMGARRRKRQKKPMRSTTINSRQ